MDHLRQRFSRNKAALATIALMTADVVVLLVALFLAFLLRFDSVTLDEAYESAARNVLPLLIGAAIYLGLFSTFRLYRHAWRYASTEIIWGVAASSFLGTIANIGIQLLATHTVCPRMTVIFWLLTVVLIGGERLLLRILHQWRQSGNNPLRRLFTGTRRGGRRVVILGGGADGVRLLQALGAELDGGYQVIGFLDDRPDRHGVLIRGVRVLGPFAMLGTLLRQRAVDEVLIAVPEVSGADIRPYVLACRKEQIPVKIIPGLRDVLYGTARARLEDITVEDLLRRPPVCLDVAQLGDYVTGKRVLVTGAGGSIGSELCRQILALDPATLILLGHGENSIHHIHQELSAIAPALVNRLAIVIASVVDIARIDNAFGKYQPQVVFHAAAHKHVPIMEANIAEAVSNNVLGTACIAQSCGRHAVERMVVISTDKAVYPSSIMGATKWLCEEGVRACAADYPGTAYVTVRFGNVLGSRGSVVPIFKEQIRRGGPVTVTHPEMTRYFMTIPEAVQLVLQAGAVGESGELYLLNMGNPVRIVDLARDMIRLSGLEPDGDIPIAFTGLRPGEKLYEMLHTGDEMLLPSAHPGFSTVLRAQYFRPDEYPGVLYRLRENIERNESDALFAYLLAIVPGFAQHSPAAHAMRPVGAAARQK